MAIEFPPKAAPALSRDRAYRIVVKLHAALRLIAKNSTGWSVEHSLDRPTQLDTMGSDGDFHFEPALDMDTARTIIRTALARQTRQPDKRKRTRR